MVRERLFMSHQNQGRPSLLAEREEEISDRPASLAVEIPRRLIGEKNARLRCEGACDRDPLLFAPRQLVRVMSQALAKSNAIERRARGAGGIPLKGELERQHHILQGREARQQMKRLKDEPHAMRAPARAAVFVQGVEVGAVEHDTPFGRCVEARKQAEQRRFAGPRSADHRQGLGTPHGKTDIIEYRKKPFGARDLF